MELKHELRTLFLKAFIKEIIKNSIEIRIQARPVLIHPIKQIISPNPIKPEYTKPKSMPKKETTITAQATQYLPARLLTPAQPTTRQAMPPETILPKPALKPMIKRAPIISIRKPALPAKVLRPIIPRGEEMQPSIMYEPAAAPGPTIAGINLGKLTLILSDPAVISVECPGPDKQILVNRSGVIQTATIMLNSDEINSIIHQFSQKARIPAEQGIFKTAIDNLVISAVISDLAGSRFVIQKRSPFSQL